MKVTKENGVTLVALIITIIVLLILAGTVFAMTIGEGGIINRAEKSAEETNLRAKEEQDTLKQYEGYIDNVLSGTSEE